MEIFLHKIYDQGLPLADPNTGCVGIDRFTQKGNTVKAVTEDNKILELHNVTVETVSYASGMLHIVFTGMEREEDKNLLGITRAFFQRWEFVNKL